MKNSIFINIIFITFLFLGCFKSQDRANKISPNNITTKQKKEEISIEVIDLLEKIDKKYLPQIIQKYFKGSNDVKLEIIDNTAIKFYYEQGAHANLVQVKLLKSLNNRYILFINGVKKDSLKYQSFFYALLKQNTDYPNITLLIIPDQIIQVFKLELNVSIVYSRLGSFWAYLSDSSSYALDFDFHGDNAYISKCFLSFGGKKEVCNIFARFIWTGNKFIFKIVSSNNQSSELLSLEELEHVRRFTSINKALVDPENVYIIDLQGANINYLPNTIVLFKHLQILVLSDNNLDSLPDVLGELKNLQVLRAENNHISYLPPSLGNLTNLLELSLSNNNIKWVPYEYARLINLQKLDLSNNNIEFLAFDMGRLQKLYSLELSNNKLEKVPTQIFKLKNLLYLDLSYNPIKVIPREFLFMPSLQYLILTGTNIDSAQINYLKLKRPNLQVVY